MVSLKDEQQSTPKKRPLPVWAGVVCLIAAVLAALFLPTLKNMLTGTQSPTVLGAFCKSLTGSSCTLIESMDKKYQLTVPADLLVFNDDWGDYLYLYQPEGSYSVAIYRYAWADLEEGFNSQQFMESFYGDETIYTIQDSRESEIQGLKAYIITVNKAGLFEETVIIEGARDLYILTFALLDSQENIYSEAWQKIYTSLRELETEDDAAPALLSANQEADLNEYQIGQGKLALYSDWLALYQTSEDSFYYHNPYQQKSLMVNFYPKNLDFTSQAARLGGAIKSSQGTPLGPLEVLFEETREINGNNCYTIAYTQHQTLLKQYQLCYLIEGQDAYYELRFSCPNSKAGRYQGEFARILESFQPKNPT